MTFLSGNTKSDKICVLVLGLHIYLLHSEKRKVIGCATTKY